MLKSIKSEEVLLNFVIFYSEIKEFWENSTHKGLEIIYKTKNANTNTIDGEEDIYFLL